MMKPIAARFLILVQILFLTAGCVSHPSATFKNSEFRCPSSDVVEPGDGYPDPIQQYPPPPQSKSIAELKDFCTKMKRRFRDSNMTVKEANQFYALLEASNATLLSDGHFLNFYNGSYGMPGGDKSESFDFTKQVMLKKVSETEYEIFYYYIECGRNYSHKILILDNATTIGGYKQMERWSESYPC